MLDVYGAMLSPLSAGYTPDIIIITHDNNDTHIFRWNPMQKYLFEKFEIMFPCEIENLYFLTNYSDDNLTNEQMEYDK